MRCGSRPPPACCATTTAASRPTPRPRDCLPTRFGSPMRTGATGCGPSPRPARHGSTEKASCRWPAPSLQARSIATAWLRTRTGTLWLGGSSGVLALDTTLAAPRLALHLLNGVPVETIELDRGGEVWIGTNEGVERYAGGTLAPSPHLPGKTEVTALYPDAEGGMWAGTATGILHLAGDGAAASAGGGRARGRAGRWSLPGPGARPMDGY